MTTDNQIATPPSIAVAFLCQRSVFGFATTPNRRAKARTRGVRTKAKTNDAASASMLSGLDGISSGWGNFQIDVV
jgi:hypothetical protein